MNPVNYNNSPSIVEEDFAGIKTFDIVVPAVDIKTAETGDGKNQEVSYWQIVGDTTRAVKGSCDPVSAGVGCVCGVICCVGLAVAQAADDDDRHHRHHHRHNNHHHHHHHHCETRAERQKREVEEAGCAFATGFCLGDCLVDTASITVGGVMGIIRATALTIFNRKPKQEDPVLWLSRKEVDEIELCDSCSCGCLKD